MNGRTGPYPYDDDHAAVSWMKEQGGLNYAMCVSFSEESYQRHGLKDPERLVEFVARRLKQAGYRGPVAMAVHDNRGTAYYHPHILLKESGRMSRVKSAFHLYGDVDKKGNGPVRGDGAYGYLLMRSRERGAIFDARIIGVVEELDAPRKMIAYRNAGR